MKKTKKELLVIKPVNLAEARGKLSKSSLDLLDITMHEIAMHTDNPDKLEYVIKAKDYVDKIGVSSATNAYTKIKETARTALRNKDILRIAGADGRITEFVLFQSISYAGEKNGVLTVELSRKLKTAINELMALRGKKIYYAMTDTLSMKSGYSKRYYPILLMRVHQKPDDRMEFAGRGSLQGKHYDHIVQIAEFRSFLGIPDSYKTNRIKDIVNTITEEIESCTKYHAEAEYSESGTGKGRKSVTHICFRMREKESSIQEETELDQLEEKVSEMTKKMKEFELLTLKDIRNITRAAKENGLEEADIEKRLRYIAEAKNKKIKNLVGYAICIMQEFEEPKEMKPKHGYMERSYTDEQMTALEKYLLETSNLQKTQ